MRYPTKLTVGKSEDKVRDETDDKGRLRDYTLFVLYRDRFQK